MWQHLKERFTNLGAQQSQGQLPLNESPPLDGTINPAQLSLPSVVPALQPAPALQPRSDLLARPAPPPHAIAQPRATTQSSPTTRNTLQHYDRQSALPHFPSPFAANNNFSFYPSSSRPADYTTSNQEHDLTHTAGPPQARKAKPISTEQHDISPQRPRFDPKVLLDPRGVKGTPAAALPTDAQAGKSQQDGGSTPTYSVAADPEVGTGSLLERLHNVSNRSEQAPSRKRKSDVRDDEDVEDDQEQKKAKSTFNGGSGGTLSVHMKAEREKIAAKTGPSTAPIDLSSGDDDEVQFVGEKVTQKATDSKSHDNEEVCYGVLSSKANISRLPSVTGQAAAAITKDYWPMTRLTVRHEVSGSSRVELLDKNGKMCGTIGDLKMGSALGRLLEGHQMNKVRMYVWLRTHRRTSGQVVGQSVSESLNIAVVLLGPRNRSAALGAYLGQQALWLASPQSAGIPLYHQATANPHQPTSLGGHSRPHGPQSVQTSSRTIEEMKRDASSMFDSLVKHEDLPEKELTNDLILTPLMSHQKQALHFMTDHEKVHGDARTDSPFSLWKSQVDKRGQQSFYNVITSQVLQEKPEPVLGGILADMMGLGKTLSILSLIAETKYDARVFAAGQPTKGQTQECNSQATLIICPKSVMSNWIEQIDAHVKPNKLSVYSYHGSNRTDDVEWLAKRNIVLTTYNTAAAEFHGEGRPLAAINWFRIVLDEAHQIRNQNTQVSKACCKLEAQRRWAVTGTPVQNGLGDLGALIKFLRVKPFDEGQNWAQYIIAPFRSANTDVIAHLRLLVDSITLRRMKDRIDLKERVEQMVRLDFTEQNRRIYEPLAGGAGKQLSLLSGGTKGGQLKGKAYAHVLKSISRLRAFCAHGLDMFNDEDRKEITEGVNPENAIAIDLGDEPSLEEYQFVTEKAAYDTLHVMGESDADRCEKCNHKFSEQKLEVVSDDDSDNISSDEEGPDCTIGYLNPCFHLICTKCKDGYVKDSQPTMTADQRHICPCCPPPGSYIRFGLFEFRRSALRDFTESRSALVTAKRIGKGKAARDTSIYNGPSEKVTALLRDLQASAEEVVPPGEPPIRSVVFTGWTTYLDLIEIALDEQHIGYVRLDGTMSVRQRTAVLDAFKSDPAVTVILVSIKAGGQGLNFTAANKVYMMEPQFNPGVEAQAIDRVHRLGQKRDVVITHYVMNDSVEDGIIKLQKRKEDLAKFTLERKMSKVEEAKKRIEDLKDLFK